MTVPVTDGKPGEEVQLDFGYLGMIPDGDRRRKLHALVFTAVFSRYCFVFLTFSQTTQAVIAGCEAAWAFFGGMFTVLVPDDLKPVVDQADRLEPGWNREWLEYMQARGLAADPGRGVAVSLPSTSTQRTPWPTPRSGSRPAPDDRDHLRQYRCDIGPAECMEFLRKPVLSEPLDGRGAWFGEGLRRLVADLTAEASRPPRAYVVDRWSGASATSPFSNGGQ